MQKGKILGVDYGLKAGWSCRYGSTGCCLPRETLKNDEHLIPTFADVCPSGFCCSLWFALKIDGTDTKQSIITREFAERFAKSGLRFYFKMKHIRLLS